MVKNPLQNLFPDRGIPFDRESDALRIPALLAPRMKSLNGIWLMCPQRARDRKAFYAPDFEPDGDRGIPVPCTAAPEVRSLRLIREFELDSSWLQKKNGAVFLRFDGAGPKLSFWVNGALQGRFLTGSEPTTEEYDISDAVRPGVNRIAIRLEHGPGDRTMPTGITGGVRLILRPTPGLLSSDIRWDGTTLYAAVTIRNLPDRDRTLALNVKLLDEAGCLLARPVSFRDLFVRAGGKADFRLRKQYRFSPLKPGGRVASALVSLMDNRSVLECRRISFDDQREILPLPLFSGLPKIGGLPFPVRGPRRDPVSLEDDGEALWISATNGLLACFGRTSGTVDALELDGISLLDRGPLPAGDVIPEDITLARENGDAEIETLAAGIRIRWRFLRSGMIRFTAELSAKKGKDGLTMRIPPHLDRIFRDGSGEMFSLTSREEKELSPGPVRGLVLTGDLKAGLALLFLTPAETFWRRHRLRHGEGCRHHGCSCGGEGSEHGNSELLLKTKRAGSVFRFDFLLLPFAAHSLRFDNLFTRS